MNHKRLLSLIVGLIAMFVISGCGNEEGTQTNTNEKLKVVTTFYPMYEFTKNVAGDLADVELLIPSTIEPHDWEPSPKDIGEIQDANLFVYNSEYMETWVPDLQNSVSEDKVKFIEASSGINLDKGVEVEEEEEVQAHSHSHSHSHSFVMDPHVWLSPVLAQKEVQTITDALIEADPENKETYKKNSQTYITKLKDLDEEYRTGLGNAKKKELVTQHTAFGYLAKEYGLVQVPIAGLSPSQEPSAQKLKDLKNFAEEHDINVIYFEELASPKVAETLADEIGASTDVLSTLEGLSKESQDKGYDYIKIMENNLDTLMKYQTE